jgi:hypothetical protein
MRIAGAISSTGVGSTAQPAFALRRLLGRALMVFTAVVLATGSSESQDSPAHSRVNDPPSLDELLKSLPSSGPRGLSDEEYRQLHPTFQCQSGKLSCDDPIARGCLGMSARIRECWRPPAGTRMTTAFFFDQNPTQPVDTAVVTLTLTPKSDGTLSSRPHFRAPAALDGAVNDLVRAVEHCQPYDMLPRRKYSEWKDVLMHIRIQLNPGQPKDAPGYPDKPEVGPPDAFRG